MSSHAETEEGGQGDGGMIDQGEGEVKQMAPQKNMDENEKEMTSFLPFIIISKHNVVSKIQLNRSILRELFFLPFIM